IVPPAGMPVHPSPRLGVRHAPIVAPRLDCRCRACRLVALRSGDPRHRRPGRDACRPGLATDARPRAVDQRSRLRAAARPRHVPARVDRPAPHPPGGAVIYVESGTLGWTVLQGKTRLPRAGAVATPEAQGELVAVDTEVILTAGDALFLPAAHGDDVRNAGDDTLVLLVANLYPAGEPGITFMDMATPMP